MSTTLVVAPHPDDETLGCGGTLLREAADGTNIHWLIVTTMTADSYDAARVAAREQEIESVSTAYRFKQTHQLPFPAATLDSQSDSDLIGAIANVVNEVEPDTVYVPFPGDIHSDHGAVFNAVAAATKPFRYPSVQRIYAFETLSETNFAVNPTIDAFRPSLFIDISPYLAQKIEIMRLYQGELGEHPFPRSIEAINASAVLRGSQCNCNAAEAFMVIREIRKISPNTNT